MLSGSALSLVRPDIRARADPRRNKEVLIVHIEVSHTFPVSVSEAFAYITDMKNWPKFWPDFVRIENPSEAKWSNPSDTRDELLNRAVMCSKQSEQIEMVEPS
jgi:hypothetical protein